MWLYWHKEHNLVENSWRINKEDWKNLLAKPELSLAQLSLAHPQLVQMFLVMANVFLIRCYGSKLPNLDGGERRDVSLYVDKLVKYLQDECKVVEVSNNYNLQKNLFIRYM